MMKKTLGIFVVFVLICLLTAALSDVFLRPQNVENLIMRIGLYGIMAIGVSFVIMTGGIDLSLGSMVCLTGCGLPWLLVKVGWSPPWALLVLLLVVLGLGWTHGWMITRWHLQPFIVTLCGLLIYRGVMRGLAADQSLGFGTAYDGLRWIATGKIPLGSLPIALPMPFVWLVIVALLAFGFLRYTVWGQHLLALGYNEEAAKNSGIRTNRLIVASYMICAFLAGFAGLLFSMDVNSAQPSDFGNFYELYAIAAAVLGGCSLRGGQGAVLGVLIGTALMQVLRNMIVLVFPAQQNMEFAIIGFVILLGVLGDEWFKRYFAKRS
ncbi:MAG: ABC transporter permease [Verrucomicrobia bacterium]|nr:MAG: ABC transporter permease [Verrucomicrobiota bacterium]